MSKAALNAAGKSLAIDLKPAGVAVGIFHPGWGYNINKELYEKQKEGKEKYDTQKAEYDTLSDEEKEETEGSPSENK